MFKEIAKREFANGVVYLLHTKDGLPVEVTDTFLPFYTKDAIGRKQNFLDNKDLGSRAERWMIGVSVSSGCPVRCKFCATGNLKRFRNLTADEIYAQIKFILDKHPELNPNNSQEFKINFTRMGDTFLNVENVKEAIYKIQSEIPNTHCFISTIGIKNSDFSWIKGNITLQLSLHSTDENLRNELIPFKNKMTIEELGKVRTTSNLKTTINMTLVHPEDFDIDILYKYFDPKYFFIKLSPVNENNISESNNIGSGIIKGVNLI